MFNSSYRPVYTTFFNSFWTPGDPMIPGSQPEYHVSNDSSMLGGTTKFHWDAGVIKGDPKRRKPTPYWYDNSEFTDWFGRYQTGDSRLYGTLTAIDGDLSTVLTDRLGPRNLVDVTQVRNQCVERFYQSLANTSVNVPVIAGEMRETMRLGSQMLGLTKRFAKNLALLGPIGSIVHSSRSAAEAWLTYAYGIAPLVSDIQGLSSLTTRKELGFRAHGSAKAQEISRVVTATRTVTYVDLYRYRIAGRYMVNNPVTDHAIRVGAFRPLSTAWELTTLSFVADWFFDVGSLLSTFEDSIAYASNGTLSDLYETSLRIQTVQGSHASETVSGSTFTRINAECKGRTSSMNRTLPNPSSFPMQRLPSLGVPTGSNQLLSAASLLRTLGFRR